MWICLLLLCIITDTLGCRSTDKRKIPKYFSESKWGGWKPNDTDWMEWIRIWGQENSSVAFDSTEVGRDPESGWPRYWKGMGKGNPGVPPPPWAFVPENYDRPSFCYLQPDPGECKNFSRRWGFNPTSNTCEQFVYSGCDGNENNFWNKYDCMQSCGSVPDSDCEVSKVNFRDYVA